MSVQQIKQAFQDLFSRCQDLDVYEIRRIFSEAIREWEIENAAWNEDRKGKAWTNDELRVILSDSPTKENCLKHARAFRRGYGAIEQIYRWAASTDTEVKAKRPQDAFVQQVRSIAKQLGWRA
jgi:hypothetical protein